MIHEAIENKTPLNGRLRTHKRHAHSGGALGKLDHYSEESREDRDSLFGGFLARFKAKRDAKATKKVRKAGAMTAKERRASKLKSKNKFRSKKGDSKLIKAGAKQTKAEKGGGKFADTLAKGMDVVGGLLNKNKSGEEDGQESTDAANAKSKKGFDPLAWYMILIYVVVIAAIAYFALK